MATSTSLERKAIRIKLTKRIRELVRKVADARGSDESTFIRQTVHQELARLNFLTSDEKKALGVVP